MELLLIYYFNLFLSVFPTNYIHIENKYLYIKYTHKFNNNLKKVIVIYVKNKIFYYVYVYEW